MKILHLNRNHQFHLLLLWLCYCIGQLESYLFSDLSYEAMKNEILAIQSTSFTSIKTAEELYNIPPAKSNGFECSPHIVRITDTKTLSKDVLRSQVFVSGEIHGDERVGPLASMVTTQLLVNSAQCIIEKRDVACEFLQKFPQLTRYQQKWLAFLATRRDTIVVPTANCLGYNFNRRDDAGVDPNRDFSYTRRDNRCFMSTTAKIIYAIMKDNLIQVVVTFHGGMVAIGYEWGSPNHHAPNDASPDHSAYSNIGKLMSTYGGKFKREKPYPVGEINSVIYPVDGGMEDWLYAEGWDSKFLTEDCQGYKELFSYLKIKARHSLLSTQHPHQVPDHPRLRNRPRKMIQNHHPSGRRQLNEVTHGNRAIVFLVETSDAKKPSTDSLGGTDNILHPNSPQNGHIPRNIRLTLSAIDLLQPYTCFQSFHLNSHDNENYFSTQWYVGGGFEVSETFLALHSFPRALVLQTTQDFTQYLRFIANDVALEKALKKNGDISQLGENKMKIVSSVMKGSTRWTFENLNNLSSSSVSSDAELLKPAKIFHGKISLQQHFFPLIKSLLSANTSMKERKFSFWLVAWSKVDSDFGRVGQGYPSHLPPQSHYSNIRTNSEWNCSYVGKENARTCQGRKYWPSDFIEIEVDLIEAKVRVKKEVLDCAWWEYHSSKHSGQSFSFVLPDEWKPQDPKLNSSLNNSNNTNQKDSYRETLPTNLIETISQSSSSSIGKNDSSSFIPYHIFHRSEESSFFTVEKIYLLISLLLTIIIAAGVLIANHLRRNRIYNALVSNRYLSLPTGFQR